MYSPDLSCGRRFSRSFEQLTPTHELLFLASVEEASRSRLASPRHTSKATGDLDIQNHHSDYFAFAVSVSTIFASATSALTAEAHFVMNAFSSGSCADLAAES